MRLIDADRLETVLSETVMVIIRDPKTDKEACVTAVFDEFGKIIHNAPIIDAVPVKHGEWVDDGGLYRCSCCNHLWSELWWTQICPIERMLKIMPYCPNCGAKMDGVEDDVVD